MITRIILNDLKEFKVWLLNWIFYKRHSMKMTLAIKLADIKQKAFNKQYHVMLLSLPTGDKLVSVNGDDIVSLKRKKWLPKDIGMLELKKTSIFYSTPLSRNNKSTPEQRREAKRKYIKYCTKYMHSQVK